MSEGFARAFGEPVFTAKIRQSTEDFRVEEIDAFTATGSGEHLLLKIEKTGMNTAFVAKQIAKWAGVAELAVGYAGMKDRHAVTVQRFSVQIPRRVAPSISALETDGLRVLEHAWHSRKLPRGALRGNRFVITLRDVDGEKAVIQQRLQMIVQYGVPNYFGEQRFGRDGDNVDNARRLFKGERMRREQRSILISAARSYLFNKVLSTRVAQGNWNHAIDGEVWMLDGTHSIFGPEPITDTLRDRLANNTIHLTGPLWGRGELRSSEAVKSLEQEVLNDDQELRIGLENAGLNQERRAIRIIVKDLGGQWVDPTTLQLSFELPPGAYATEVIAELMA